MAEETYDGYYNDTPVDDAGVEDRKQINWKTVRKAIFMGIGLLILFAGVVLAVVYLPDII